MRIKLRNKWKRICNSIRKMLNNQHCAFGRKQVKPTARSKLERNAYKLQSAWIFIYQKEKKYLGHFLTKSNDHSLNEREIFKVLFDPKSFYIYCSKVSSFTSIQCFSPFLRYPSKTFSNVSF